MLEQIDAACRRVGRDPAEVTLVAVSKTVPVERVEAAIEAGLTTLGENRVQEAEAKIEALTGASWHLVGHLQANKARRAVRLFDVIESVDSFALATRLDRMAGEVMAGASGAGSMTSTAPVESAGLDRPLPVYLQVNVDADPAKSGFSPDELRNGLSEIAGLDHLELRGLMTVGALVDDPARSRPTFVALRQLSESLRGLEPRLGPGLSMGMSDDYPIAVEEGATVVRVGQALFGSRPAG